MTGDGEEVILEMYLSGISVRKPPYYSCGLETAREGGQNG